MRRIVIYAASWMAAVLLWAPLGIPADAPESDVAVVRVSVAGNTVTVTVANHRGEDARGTVYARALAGGAVLEAAVPAVFSAAGETDVSVSFPAAVEQVIAAGAILDDGAPF